MSYRNFGLGVLAALGLIWIILTVALNTSGILGMCTEESREIFADTSPSGDKTLITTLTYCQSGEMKLLVELASRNSGNSFMMLTESGRDIGTLIF
jgi:hypothetical protein